MSKHTPGKWEATQGGWICSGQIDVCEYAGCGSHEAEWANTADLTLALAAPELLEALRNLLAVMSQAIASGDWRVDGACDPDAEVIRARQAIAKATQP